MAFEDAASHLTGATSITPSLLGDGRGGLVEHYLGHWAARDTHHDERATRTADVNSQVAPIPDTFPCHRTRTGLTQGHGRCGKHKKGFAWSSANVFLGFIHLRLQSDRDASTMMCWSNRAAAHDGLFWTLLR